MSNDILSPRRPLVKPKASAFIHQMKTYNKHDINKEIAVFEEVLKQQEELSKDYELDNKDIVDDCKDFFEENNELIEEQHYKMEQLNKYIKSTVERNKKNAEINTELNELVNSKEYIKSVDRMREIKENINNLKEFLRYTY